MVEQLVFSGQNVNERVLLHRNQHLFLLFFQLFKVLFFSLLLGFAIVGVLTVLKRNDINFYGAVVGALIFILGAMYYVILYLKTFLAVTDQRIVVSRQNGIFRNDTRAANLQKMREVAFKINGTVESVLGFGTLMIETVEEIKSNKRFVFPYCSQVKAIKLYLDQLENLLSKGKKSEELPMFEESLMPVKDSEGMRGDINEGEGNAEDGNLKEDSQNADGKRETAKKEEKIQEVPMHGSKIVQK